MSQHATKHQQHRRHHQRHEALKQGSLEGLLASLPVLAFLRREEVNAIGGLTRRLWNDSPALKEASAGVERKYGITGPMVVGAVVIGAAVLHGALRGVEKAERDHERKLEAQAGREFGSFTEREDARRRDGLQRKSRAAQDDGRSFRML